MNAKNDSENQMAFKRRSSRVRVKSTKTFTDPFMIQMNHVKLFQFKPF